MKNSLKFAACVFLGPTIFPSPLRADTHQPARPGTLNYVEGQVYMGRETLDGKSIGQVEVAPGETLSTAKGKAEILLTPGVFVRVGDESSATMISAGLTDTRMSVDQGEAMIEVAEIHPENNLRVVEDGRATGLVKTGLYDFNENLHVVRVLDGEAMVEDGNRVVKIKSGHMVDLTIGEPLRARKFDKKETEAEDLYHWTSLRSGYLAEANADEAPAYAYGGFGWYGDGWYWDPWFDAYTFLPGDGIFFSPFGWGFYSPWCAFGAPFFWGGGRYYHHFSPDGARWGAEAHYGLPKNYGHGVQYASKYEGGVARGSRMGFARGGGFHGGGGGFSGGGGGHR
jgi:uncharacterized membrane protein YgcG